MHADTLYHRMLDQEKAIAAAKAEGLPVPEYPPLLSSKMPSKTPAPPIAGIELDVSKLPKNTQIALKKRLEGLIGEAREVEERAIRAEIMTGHQVQTELSGIWEKQDLERQQRREEGKSTIGDRVTELLRFRPSFKTSQEVKPEDEKPMGK
jgi:hypothetical protein